MTKFPAAVREHIEALVRADADRLEAECAAALALQHPDKIGHLFIVDQMSLGSPIPRVVASYWPLPRSASQSALCRGEAVTVCCGAYATFHDTTLCCKVCWEEVGCVV